MFQSQTLGKRCFILAAIGLLTFLMANVQAARAADSSCVTCHLDQEMLKKNITTAQGKKSAMQSGAG